MDVVFGLLWMALSAYALYRVGRYLNQRRLGNTPEPPAGHPAWGWVLGGFIALTVLAGALAEDPSAGDTETPVAQRPQPEQPSPPPMTPPQPSPAPAPAPKPPAPSRPAYCIDIPPVTLKSLRDGLVQGRKISAAGAVAGSAVSSGPADLVEGVFYVTADIEPNPGLSTWALGASMFREGGGFIVALTPSARAGSNLGDLVDVEAVGLSADASGIARSTNCVEDVG